MKHLKIYEKSMFEKIDDNEKYIKFIKDKFKIKLLPYGSVELESIYDTGIKILITLSNIEANKLLSILDFFKSCKGKIEISNHINCMYYRPFLPNDFLKKLDIEIDALKYNM